MTTQGTPVTTPRISVVVAFFNNGDDLADCLDSIAAQSVTDLEVIMVDDGSTDDGAQIAGAKAAADPRFTLVQPGHGGPGGARNRGVELARGEFLAFVDGDDVLPGNAYDLLLHTLESSGSDFASGAVLRIGPKGINPSALHSLAIKGRQTRTQITRTPRLLYDVSVWNKLFRRRFWDEHQLSFPERVVWEDIRLMTKAHVLARAVDVIPDVVLLLARARPGRPVDHAEPRQHRQPARPDDRAGRHRRVHRRALDGQAAAGASAQGPQERPVALRPGPAQGDRGIPRRVHRPGERLPGPRSAAGCCAACPPPRSWLTIWCGSGPRRSWPSWPPG